MPDENSPIDADPHAESVTQPADNVPRGNRVIQLVLIPLLLVASFVLVIVLFSRVAHHGVEPMDLVRALQQPNRESWHNALALATVLREPEYEAVKRDKQVADQLVRILDDQIQSAKMDPGSVKLRAYLCRALGEFHRPEVLPTLVRAAGTARDTAETDVQQAAVEAIAVLANNVGVEAIRADDPCRETLLQLVEPHASPGADRQRPAAVRTAAAYTLGVIGGSRAEERLVRLLEDPAADVRYNAALGLARHGNTTAMPVLCAMLDPDNEEVVAGETSDRGREWKRELVVNNAIRAVLKLAESKPHIDLDEVIAILRNLAESQNSAKITTLADEALHALQSRGD